MMRRMPHHRVSEVHEMGASEKTNCLDVKKRNKKDWRKYYETNK